MQKTKLEWFYAKIVGLLGVLFGVKKAVPMIEAAGTVRQQSLAQMIAEVGFNHQPDYDVIQPHPDINEQNFPLTGQAAPVDAMLPLSQKDLGGQDMTMAEIEAAIRKKGYRPATLVDLLAYAKERWNGKDWITALGSCLFRPDGDRRVPYLYEVDGGRGLLLVRFYYEHRWSENSLFLVVCK